MKLDRNNDEISAYLTERGKKQSDERNSTYDILKLLLALQVVFSHSWELLYPPGGEAVKHFSLFNRSLGNVAVHAFFVLSGYFITMSCVRSESTLDFVWKRLRRLLPAYVVAMGFSKWLGKVCGGFSDLPTPYIINGCVWTLYYEIALYCCVMFMKIWRVLNKETVGAIGCVLLLAHAKSNGNMDVMSTIVLPMVFMFVCGSYIYLSKMESELSLMGLSAMAVLLVIQFFPSIFDTIADAIPLIYGPDIGDLAYQWAYLISLPVAVLAIGRLIKIRVSHFPDLSYGVYLFGWPIQQTIIYFYQREGNGLSPEKLFVVSGIASLLAAGISWYAIEKHVLRIKLSRIYEIEELMKRLVNKDK